MTLHGWCPTLPASSVQLLCTLCLCGGKYRTNSNHRDTEYTEVAQRIPDGHLPFHAINGG